MTTTITTTHASADQLRRLVAWFDRLTEPEREQVIRSIYWMALAHMLVTMRGQHGLASSD